MVSKLIYIQVRVTRDDKTCDNTAATVLCWLSVDVMYCGLVDTETPREKTGRKYRTLPTSARLRTLSATASGCLLEVGEAMLFDLCLVMDICRVLICRRW